ncbi:MAG: hypothetical protein IPH37_14100 [Burkholderiales bacterium]|jgi:uncharacterized cupredoxin-like copper-binding protein|nr:hypothetical protein [Burkholderiales bacterium]MBK9346775.1 hypothetical protein [Burkholderiales bacterium]
MNLNFQTQHASMLLKYAGISFISGAVNHGFFSGERSLWTAAIGIVLFVAGAWWEHHQTLTTAETPKSLGKTLLWGTLLSIGLGFFTGGLQHFPDSPERSAWVVPTGFVLSVIALAIGNDFHWRRSITAYLLAVGALVTGASYGTGQWLLAHPEWAAGGGGHGHGEAKGLVAQVVGRSITVHMDDTMRFMPDKIDVQMGETVRFVVHNGGAVAHEFVLGTDQEIAAHAELMRQIAAGKDVAHDHGGGAALNVPAGAMGEIVVTFGQAGPLEIACLIPGHLEAGMRARIVVGTQPVAGAAPPPDMAGMKH